MNQPLLPEVGVVCIPPEYWDVAWLQTEHQVISRLSLFFRVVWMDPSENWRETLRDGLPSVPVFSNAKTFENLTVHRQEFWLPQFFKPRWLSRYTFLERVRRAQEYLRSQGCKKIVLYLWTPEYGLALEAGRWDLVAYHIDDEYSFSEIEVPTPPEELTVIRESGQVFVHSAPLMEKKGKINPHTSYSPNGVYYAAFATPVPEPVDIAAIPHPRVGYAGFIKKQLDWTLLRELVFRHPGWSFVFVGKQSPHPELDGILAELKAKGNVYFLGDKSAAELALYPQHFDVCLMPYELNDYTKFIYPLKLHEYLASGSPTISTPIPAVTPYNGLVALPTSIPEWESAIADSLRPEMNSQEKRAARQAVAKQHDWESLTRRIAGTMAERLGSDIQVAWKSQVGDAQEPALLI
ncbi:MAG TPA: glycosyltransferase [Candidatus Saccharimonadales bacterium]|nr:glycosyltransferase [Candidatus Saccharimonadales bacterium]